MPAASETFAKRYWELNHVSGLKKIILNTSGSTLDHQWRMTKIKEICFEILSEINNVEIHIISKDNTHYNRLKENLGSEKLIKIIGFRENILDIAALIKDANLLISPNTFAIHFGSAFSTPTLAIYISEQTTVSWGSLSSKHINIVCKNSIENVENTALVKNTKTLLN